MSENLPDEILKKKIVAFSGDVITFDLLYSNDHNFNYRYDYINEVIVKSRFDEIKKRGDRSVVGSCRGM
jgi:hypothetical protein